MTAARSSARLKELGPMKIKPTLVGFSGEYYVESCSQKNPKAQAVNKAQRQLRPEPYFPVFFKSRAQECVLNIMLDHL